jgi:uncharacterized protein YndB with AHSA1/START domain
MREKLEHEGRAVRDEIRVDCTPEELWNAWAKPDGISKWFVDAQKGDMETDEKVTWVWETFGFEIPLQVFEAERGRYLAFGGPARSPEHPQGLQEILITQDGGSCVLRLVNSGFRDGSDWDDEYEGVVSGWAMALATLKRWIESYKGGERSHHIVARPAAFEYEDLAPLFTTADGLKGWLASEVRAPAAELQPGAALDLELVGGGALTGEVLARTSRELLFSWEERRGVLGLKCFSLAPGSRMVALDFSGWGIAERDFEAVRAMLDAAVDRLVPRIPTPSAT